MKGLRLSARNRNPLLWPLFDLLSTFSLPFYTHQNPKKDTHVSHSECCCTGGGAWGKEMACVTCPEQFTPEYEKLCGATNQPEEEPVYTEPPTEESVTVENETDDNSIEGIFSKIECNL